MEFLRILTREKGKVEFLADLDTNETYAKDELDRFMQDLNTYSPLTREIFHGSMNQNANSIPFIYEARLYTVDGNTLTAIWLRDQIVEQPSSQGPHAYQSWGNKSNFGQEENANAGSRRTLLGFTDGNPRPSRMTYGNEANGPLSFARQPTAIHSAFMADLAKQVNKINQPLDETAGCCFFPFCILDTKAARKCRMIYFSFW
ncbi:hypothetical protein Ciccas_007984 [Cichlidogyrus casuarinus]|uniref:Uncharacterized protein n=1 Tax=Cichlidogyrus casuarinus TaxID=1844966 RepID=A0ABD2Q5E1_9PLAT